MRILDEIRLTCRKCGNRVLASMLIQGTDGGFLCIHCHQKLLRNLTDLNHGCAEVD